MAMDTVGHCLAELRANDGQPEDRTEDAEVEHARRQRHQPHGREHQPPAPAHRPGGDQGDAGDGAHDAPRLAAQELQNGVDISLVGG